MVEPRKIFAGIRIGFWNVYEGKIVGGWDRPFTCVGMYLGEPLGEHLPGTLIRQELIEGTLEFRVGVLGCLETILIIQEYVPEMFEYEDWEVLNY